MDFFAYIIFAIEARNEESYQSSENTMGSMSVMFSFTTTTGTKTNNAQHSQ